MAVVAQPSDSFDVVESVVGPLPPHTHWWVVVSDVAGGDAVELFAQHATGVALQHKQSGPLPLGRMIPLVG